MQKKTFRLSDETCAELRELSDSWGVSQGAAVERAIHLAIQDAIPDAIRLPYASGGDASGSVAISALADQIAVKDGQIASLMEQLAESTKAIQGAQALHHETVGASMALESAEQKKGRLARLVAAWRG